MNENLDLTKILEGCPAGTEFYSSVLGNVKFVKISPFNSIKIRTNNNVYSVTRDGRWYSYIGECTLFPSKDQRDWSKFERFWDKPKVKKFDPKTLQPFDKVLVKDRSSEWACALFSHIDADVPYPVYSSSGCFKFCIPYNDETKYLIGTNKNCPEYYKWWEE